MEKNNLVKAKVNFEYMGLIILFTVISIVRLSVKYSDALIEEIKKK